MFAALSSPLHWIKHKLSVYCQKQEHNGSKIQSKDYAKPKRLKRNYWCESAQIPRNVESSLISPLSAALQKCISLCPESPMKQHPPALVKVQKKLNF